MQLVYHLIKEWPPLSWLAVSPLSSAKVDVYHGSNVEVRQSWFCEAIWDAPFAEGNFDETDVVFGSGGRIREDSLVFVSSGSTVDRLQWMMVQNHVVISNSLACLLKVVKASVDPTYPFYFEDFETIIYGIHDVKPTLDTSAGQVQFVYFRNCQWDGSGLHILDKPNPARNLSAFSTYQEFLESSLWKVSQNLSAQERNHPFELVATLSSGYDSSAVAVISRTCPVREVLSFKTSRKGLADSGKSIAQTLKLKQTVIEHHSWQNEEFPEIPFIASDAKGEDVFFKGAEAHLQGRVLLTGFHGDKVWEKTNPKLSPNIERGDQSGLSLTEYRLWATFIHFPVPFLGVRNVRDINAISYADEMKPWDIGGTYNRPICRRIVEDIGVPRHEFGMTKKAGSILFRERSSFLTEQSKAHYYAWLNAHAKEWTDKGKLPPLTHNRIRWLVKPVFKLAYFCGRVFRGVGKLLPDGAVKKYLQRTGHIFSSYDQKEYLFKFLFPWALEKAQDRYTDISLFH